MKARISHLNKTEAEWNKLVEFVPEAGELIIYAPDKNYSYARLKIGDGKTLLKDLSFTITAIVDDLIESLRYQEIIDGGNIAGRRD